MTGSLTSIPRRAAAAGPALDLSDTLAAQRAAFLAEGPPSAEVRIDRIDRVIDLMLGNAERIVAAISADFGHRSSVQSLLSEVIGPLPDINYTRAHVKRWMRPTPTKAGPLGALGGRAWIDWQPLGVVGIISPWNFPVGLTFDPAVQAISAGNRVMLKLSEHVPRVSELLREEIARRFDPTEMIAFTGGPELGAAFAGLPFDHLMLTGGPSIARHVQRAAADNLVPVTLELGGKNPVVVSAKADLTRAADRIMSGKTMNAGQLCLSPDYLLVPTATVEATVDALRASVSRMLPTLVDNDDFSSIVDARQYQRVQNHLADARAKGARIVELNPAGEDFSRQPHHKIPPTLVLDVTEEMTIMQEEIFGPVLIVAPYRDIDEALAVISRRPKPLAAYYFGPDDADRQRFMSRVYAGGITINDVILHCTVAGLPFGGVGESGTGYYHGRSGFETFSHARAVLRAPGRISANTLIGAPYTKRKQAMLRMQLEFERRRSRARRGGGK